MRVCFFLNHNKHFSSCAPLKTSLACFLVFGGTEDVQFSSLENKVHSSDSCQPKQPLSWGFLTKGSCSCSSDADLHLICMCLSYKYLHMGPSFYLRSCFNEVKRNVENFIRSEFFCFPVKCSNKQLGYFSHCCINMSITYLAEKKTKKPV